MENDNKSQIIKGQGYDMQLRDFEGGLINFLAQHNLPSEGIFVSVPERINVFKNLEGVIIQIDDKEKDQSLYLSKFIAGVASGLFDAALNYLWDETILQIRKRVVQYDLEYFYDNAVVGDKRKRLKDESDLNKVDDYDLIKGAKEIGLISELGSKHLEYINYMRNWASAAHPNQNEISGLQLVSWLETCVKEVISLPISNLTIKIKQLLSSIKTTSISPDNAKEIAVFFTDLTQDQVNNLASGFFGIYTKPDTDSQTLQNINRLLPLIWERVDEDTRDSFGLKYGNFVAANYQYEKKLAREFLQLVNAESYIPDDLRVVEIETAITNLLTAHRGLNNFYNEPSFAGQLQRIVGDPPKLPKQINKKYVLALVDVYLTNGHGVTTGAQPIYEDLISKFDSQQANIAALSFNDSTISNKLQHSLCQKKFKGMVELIKPIITSPPVKELIDKIEKFPSRLDNLKNDKAIKTLVDSLRVLLK
ncbi:MAG TPA: hypothetical protein VL442_17120 [Mucilaginibacter sp.]|jgi:hypothetical protein|nr:hypothetical protein [Mucilaginibacter sp.]